MGFNGRIPYGPADPTWKKWPDFVSKNLTNNRVVVPIPYYGYIARDLKAVADYPKGTLSGLPKGAIDFLKAYLGALGANYERFINGHKGSDEGALLQATSTAWNKSHASNKKYTFQLGDASSNNFVSYVLGGNIDKARRPPLTINVGDAIGAPVKKVLPKPSAAHIALHLAPSSKFAAAAARFHSFPIVPNRSPKILWALALTALAAGFFVLKGKR
jgi:hypothetical protein